MSVPLTTTRGTISRLRGITATGEVVEQDFIVPHPRAWESMLAKWIKARSIVDWEYIPVNK